MRRLSPCTFPNRMIFHVDMDAFYASVEQFENPSLRGKPVIIGGVDSNRGVVSTASYEARVFGVHSAMPVAQARKKCPHGIFLSGRHYLYGEYSRRLMDCLSEYTPILEQLSVDEAFLDMTGSERLFGEAEESGLKLKLAIRDRLGITASVGVAENKFLAKLASDVNKPFGVKVVFPNEVQNFLDPMSVDKLWGVGKKTLMQLHQVGFYTIAQLREQPLKNLAAHFGENFAAHLFHLVRGQDDRDVITESQEKSISHEQTFEVDTSNEDILTAALLNLSERVARRARKDALKGRTITFVWRNPDFSRQSHSQSLPEPTDSSQTIFGSITELFKAVTRHSPGLILQAQPAQAKKSGKTPRRFRLIGVRLSNFSLETQQLSLFDNRISKSKLDKAMDAVRDKFGESAINRARLTDPDNYHPGP